MSERHPRQAGGDPAARVPSPSLQASRSRGPENLRNPSRARSNLSANRIKSDMRPAQPTAHVLCVVGANDALRRVDSAGTQSRRVDEPTPRGMEPGAPLPVSSRRLKRVTTIRRSTRAAPVPHWRRGAAPDMKTLRLLYVDEGRTEAEVAQLLGISRSRVAEAM